MMILESHETSRTRSAATEAAIELVEDHAAQNYSPLPVVAASAEGAWITDVDGRRYLDFLAAYSAVNFGHCHPEITATAHAQLDTVTLVSRAFHSDNLGPFCAALARLCGGCFAIELCWVRRLAREDRDVASQWNLQMDWVIFPFALVILLESFSQTVGFNPHNRVLARIECVI